MNECGADFKTLRAENVKTAEMYLLNVFKCISKFVGKNARGNLSNNVGSTVTMEIYLFSMNELDFTADCFYNINQTYILKVLHFQN